MSDKHVEAASRGIALSQGHDPDEMAPLSVFCTADNKPVPWWVVYEEQAEAAITAWTASLVADAPGVVERLNQRVEMVDHGNGDVRDHPDEECHEAADTILALTADRERLRTALRHVKEINGHYEDDCEECQQLAATIDAALKEPANA